MPDHATADSSSHEHAFGFLNARTVEGLTVVGRRSAIKAGLAGFGGLTLPRLLEAERSASSGSARSPGRRSVILLWMAGGPSHIDTWDPKPDMPLENRGPFGTISTTLPGVRLCEYYPKQAALMKKLTLVRSVDARKSSHQPNQVFQTGNREAAPRVNANGKLYPAIGSVVARHVTSEAAGASRLPAYVALNLRDRTHFAWGGWLGQQYDPFVGDNVAKRFELPAGLSSHRLLRRRSLLEQLDSLREHVDLSGSMEAVNRYQQQAVDMVLGQRARHAFDLSLEPATVRERYGEHEWCQKALLARRLVESGVSFVTVDLSNHRSSGTWDTHGDNIPPYGGIWNGLRPLLPVFDHLFTTLVTDLDQRGLLDQVLVIAMGEFGRTPKVGTQGSKDGRNHWPHVLSMMMAGGGFRHGQVIGSTERDGGAIRERPVTPGDLAATIYHHMGVPLDTTYEDFSGRPRLAVTEGGEPLRELV